MDDHTSRSHITHSFGDGHDHGPCPTCGTNPHPVDGWVWCEQIRMPDHTGPHNGHSDPSFYNCPGPHRAIMLGPVSEETNDE